MRGTPLLYYGGKYLTYITAKLFFGYEVLNPEYVPDNGPFIIASNHVSYYDPNLVGTASPRACHFMAKKELFTNKKIGWILRNVNAIPVNRQAADIESIKTVLSVLKKNEGLVMFPEGTRSRDGKLGKVKSGIGMIAVRSGAAVVPAYIKNSEKPFKNRLTGKRVIVTFAKPIKPDYYKDLPPGKDGYRMVAAELERRIKLLKENIDNSVNTGEMERKLMEEKEYS
ncbi:MAG: 1-acyl-sn-glycerol-3-phosphate acyltransferase [candidate division Zixibacteria bacterium]|nr:1-acyl-sn-glycerol-3-phosphate acyltransferase [candidate division Zixibacteria bacterium]